ncbi:hypothetical protein HJG60_010404 [Phyllostomus discolor]|uniref:Uncharacterized protein n=1 Tax=Phyllostomus discolor TaxID=89673 RepID=A0A834AT33_9CHIR|nr:hypothetical protein HJG60_010404 [Phyllostomus discolor]
MQGRATQVSCESPRWHWDLHSGSGWLAGGHAEAGVIWRPGTPQKQAFGWRAPSASPKRSLICTHVLRPSWIPSLSLTQVTACLPRPSGWPSPLPLPFPSRAFPHKPLVHLMPSQTAPQGRTNSLGCLPPIPACLWLGAAPQDLSWQTPQPGALAEPSPRAELLLLATGGHGFARGGHHHLTQQQQPALLYVESIAPLPDNLPCLLGS